MGVSVRTVLSATAVLTYPTEWSHSCWHSRLNASSSMMNIRHSRRSSRGSSWARSSSGASTRRGMRKISSRRLGFFCAIFTNRPLMARRGCCICCGGPGAYFAGNQRCQRPRPIPSTDWLRAYPYFVTVDRITRYDMSYMDNCL